MVTPKDGNRISKIDMYLNCAENFAYRSTCIKRKYGAVIVKNDVVISTGYNGSPRGFENCCDIGKCPRVEKRCRTDFADIQNKKECGGNRQWQNHYLRNWAANTKGKGII